MPQLWYCSRLMCACACWLLLPELGEPGGAPEELTRWWLLRTAPAAPPAAAPAAFAESPLPLGPNRLGVCKAPGEGGPGEAPVADTASSPPAAAAVPRTGAALIAKLSSELLPGGCPHGGELFAGGLLEAAAAAAAICTAEDALPLPLPLPLEGGDEPTVLSAS